MKIKVYIYSLVNSEGEREFAVVNDPGDKICIGIREKGRYLQYDSYEAWYLSDWAARNGLTSDSRGVEIEVPPELLR